MDSVFLAAPAILGLVNASGVCFDSWVGEREAGIFNASARSSIERGAIAYNCALLLRDGWV